MTKVAVAVAVAPEVGDVVAVEDDDGLLLRSHDLVTSPSPYSPLASQSEESRELTRFKRFVVRLCC